MLIRTIPSVVDRTLPWKQRPTICRSTTLAVMYKPWVLLPRLRATS